MDQEFRKRWHPHHPRHPRHPHHNNRTGGVVLIIIGILFLLHRIPQTAAMIPHWFFTWPVLLIAIGIFVGIKNGFRSFGWVIPILIGAYALLYEHNLISLNLRPYALPIGLIVIGICVVLKRNRKSYLRKFYEEQRFSPQEEVDPTDNSINISSIFGSVEKNVFTKDFKGGTITSVFGGSQINLTQSDIQGGVAVIDVSIIFGGVDIVIPANWTLKNEISVVFGGIEDGRTTAPNQADSGKTLILKGNILFGGIEIKSY